MEGNDYLLVIAIPTQFLELAVSVPLAEKYPDSEAAELFFWEKQTRQQLVLKTKLKLFCFSLTSSFFLPSIDSLGPTC